MTDRLRNHPDQASVADDDPPVVSGIHADPTEVPIHLEELFADRWLTYVVLLDDRPLHAPKHGEHGCAIHGQVVTAKCSHLPDAGRLDE